MKLNWSEKLLLLAVILSVIHHLDHVLRVDHSGWPFLPRVTPFTFSLMAYPIFISLFLAHSKPWFRVMGTALLFLFATLAHVFFEPFRDKFHTWTYGSNLPGHIGEQNLLGIQSPILGVVSIGLALLLSLSLFGALLSFFRDARKPVLPPAPKKEKS
ncbi:MAG: hypothetical protein H7Y12_10325 [Sphingobacteriaceae bacterium]|nr:hypothetical protein [Cytophagaceae bacterium]